MTLENNSALLLCYFKFLYHFAASSEFKVELRSGNDQLGAKFVLTSVALMFDLWPWIFVWTSPLSTVITPVNFMTRWQEHCENGVTNGQTGGRITVLRAARSQLKKTVRVEVTNSWLKGLIPRVYDELQSRKHHLRWWLLAFCITDYAMPKISYVS